MVKSSILLKGLLVNIVLKIENFKQKYLLFYHKFYNYIDKTELKIGIYKKDHFVYSIFWLIKNERVSY